MKATISILAIALLFYSCSKSSSNPGNNSDATLTYKVNDSIINIPDQGNNLYMNKVAFNGVTVYSFTGVTKNNNSQLEGFSFQVTADTLPPQSFTFDSVWYDNINMPGSNGFIGIGIAHDGFTYIPVGQKNKGSFILTITSNANGLINGNFSGTLMHLDSLNINTGISYYSYNTFTEGKFQNVKVLY